MNRRQFSLAFPVAGIALAQTTVPAGADRIVGHWQGTLTTPGGNLRLALDITRTFDSFYLGTLTSLDQGHARIPVVVKADGDSVHLEIKPVGATYDGQLKGPDGLTGTWKQGGPPTVLEFTRTAAPVAAPVAAGPRRTPIDLPLDIEVPCVPVPFPAGGQVHLVYELHITNFHPAEEVPLKRIEVLDGTATLAQFEGLDLIGILTRIGAPDADNRVLEAGHRAIAFLWVSVATAPRALAHRITAADRTLDIAAIPVSQIRPLVLSPPLRGSGWMAFNGPSNTSLHRRALMAVGGRARIAQRFAIDWVKVSENGRRFEGDEKDNQAYFGYGSEVLAVKDSMVAAVKDGIAQNVPGVLPPPTSLDAVPGNHVVLDLGAGQFALYAHLQPGSIRVKVGDRVKRGQTLALLGNSGNSTAPHLHFHVTDANAALAAEGLPYVLDAGHHELPRQNDRIDFG